MRLSSLLKMSLSYAMPSINKKITSFEYLTDPDGNDVIPIVDVSDTTMSSSGTTKKIRLNTLIAIAASGNEIIGEEVSGAGTSWALAFAPYSTTLRLFGMGQRLKLTEDYTVDVDGNITTLTAFPAGSLLADYVTTS